MFTSIRNSISRLFNELKAEAKTFVREEVQMAKKEMSEKIASYRKDVTGIAAGGVVAYAGLIVFLAGLGALLAWQFRRMGLDPLLALFAGLGILGLLAIVAGTAALAAGISAVKKRSLVPERTIRTLQHLNGTEPAATPKPPKPTVPDTRTIEQVEASAVETAGRGAELLEDLADRVKLKHARRQATAAVRKHPYRWGLLAASCGAAGSYVLTRRLAR